MDTLPEGHDFGNEVEVFNVPGRGLIAAVSLPCQVKSMGFLIDKGIVINGTSYKIHNVEYQGWKRVYPPGTRVGLVLKTPPIQ